MAQDMTSNALLEYVKTLGGKQGGGGSAAAYSISANQNIITLTGSDGSSSSATVTGFVSEEVDPTMIGITNIELEDMLK